MRRWWPFVLLLGLALGYWLRGHGGAPVERPAPPPSEFEPAIGFPNAYHVRPR